MTMMGPAAPASSSGGSVGSFHETDSDEGQGSWRSAASQPSSSTARDTRAAARDNEAGGRSANTDEVAPLLLR
jgi:hypothetical protein